MIVVLFHAVPPSSAEMFCESAALRNGLVKRPTVRIPIPLCPDIVSLRRALHRPAWEALREFLFDLAPGKLQCEPFRSNLSGGGYAIVNAVYRIRGGTGAMGRDAEHGERGCVI